LKQAHWPIFGRGSVFVPFLWTGLTFACFHAEERQPKEDSLNWVDRLGTRTTEKNLRIRALSPCGPIAEAGSRPDITFSPFSVENDTELSRQCVGGG